MIRARSGNTGPGRQETWLSMTRKAGIMSCFAICLLLAAGGCTPGKTNTSHERTGKLTVTAKAFRLPGGWGYKIEVNHRLYIYQNQVPCLPGKQFFPTRQSAMAVAAIVKQKIIEGRSPSVTKEEVEKAVPALNN